MKKNKTSNNVVRGKGQNIPVCYNILYKGEIKIQEWLKYKNDWIRGDSERSRKSREYPIQIHSKITVNKLASSKMRKLKSWQAYKLRSSHANKLTRWQIYKLQTNRWQDDKMTRWQVDKMTSWHDGMMTWSRIIDPSSLIIDDDPMSFVSCIQA